MRSLQLFAYADSRRRDASRAGRGGVAIGAAAGLAPQIGSAISAVGFLVLMANATMQAQGILSMLPVAVIFAAAMSGWWIAWGRTERLRARRSPARLALGC